MKKYIILLLFVFLSVSCTISNNNNNNKDDDKLFWINCIKKIYNKENFDSIYASKDHKNVLTEKKIDNHIITVKANWTKVWNYFDVANFRFSNNNSYLFLAKKDNFKDVIVKDWIESKEYEEIDKFYNNITFINDWNDYIFIAKKENWKYIVVNNSEESNEYNKITYLVSDYQNYWFWYIWKTNQKKYEVIINWEVKHTHNSEIRNLKISNKWENYYYTIKKDKWLELYKNWSIIERYAYIDYIHSSNNYDTYFVRWDKYWFIGYLKNGNYVVIKDDKRSKEYSKITNLTTNNDWSEYMYIAEKEKDKNIVITNWKESEEYFSVYNMTTSNDWKIFWYTAKKDKKWKNISLIIDWKKIQDFDASNIFELLLIDENNYFFEALMYHFNKKRILEGFDSSLIYNWKIQKGIHLNNGINYLNKENSVSFININNNEFETYLCNLN